MTAALRTLATSLLLLAVVAGMQGTVLVQGLYLARSGYIATHLCENRQNPDVECDGFCFLADRVAEAHGHSDSTALQSPVVEVRLASVLPAQPLVPPARTADAARSFPSLLAPSSGVSPVPFRPPWKGIRHG